MREFMTDLKAAWDHEIQKIQANEEHRVKICEAALCISRKALADLRIHLLKINHFHRANKNKKATS